MPDNQSHVRDMRATDLSAVRDLALVNKMFAPEDMGAIDDMAAGYLDGSMPGHQWVVAESKGVIAGGAYYALEPFADRVWNLYFLAVAPDVHGQGVGSSIVDHVVSRLRSAGPDSARVLIVETSSTEAYRRARSFYVGRRFVEEARIREFYGPLDDKIVFWMRLND